MKTALKKHLIVDGFILIFALIFVFGGMYSRFMTNQIAVHEQEQLEALYLSMVDGATSLETFESNGEDMVFEVVRPTSTFEVTLSLIESYQYYQGETAKGVIYLINSYGNMPNMQIAYAVDFATDSVVAVKVFEHSETDTPTYFQKLKTDFYNQFNQLAFDDVAMSIDTVAGATNSSKGFELALTYAREIYAVDFGFEIPRVVMTINSIIYNFDLATFIEYPYIADVTYGDDNTNLVSYLKSDFSFGEVIDGVEPAQDVQKALQAYALLDGSVSNQVSFVAYDDVTNIISMETKGYSPIKIQVEVDFNEDFSSIESITIVSDESYDHNDEYSGSGVPAVENSYKNKYLNDGTILDGVAGATVTSHAMAELFDLLNQFRASVNGGN